MKKFFKEFFADYGELLGLILFLLVLVLFMKGCELIADAQPLPVASSTTNAGVELRWGTVEWRRSTNARVFSYDWGFSNAGTNQTGNTTLTNATVWFALGTNQFWIRPRATNGEVGPMGMATWRARTTGVVNVLPGYDWRAKRFMTSPWSPWAVSTNTAVVPTNAQQEFRVRLSQTNWWVLE